MFNFLSNKKKAGEFYAPCSGRLTKITDLEDPVFANKLLGDGYAVEPEDGVITSPVNGEVTSIFPTKHAIGIKTKNNDEVLVHMGIDTVELKGEPFNIKVAAGDKVNAATSLAVVDLAMLAQLNKPATVIVVFTNKPSVDAFSALAEKTVASGDKLGEIID